MERLFNKTTNFIGKRAALKPIRSIIVGPKSPKPRNIFEKTEESVNDTNFDESKEGLNLMQQRYI